MKIDKEKMGKWIVKVNQSGLLLDNVGVVEFAKELSTIPEMKEFIHSSVGDCQGQGVLGLLATVATVFQLGFEVGAVWARPELELPDEVKADAKAN